MAGARSPFADISRIYFLYFIYRNIITTIARNLTIPKSVNYLTLYFFTRFVQKIQQRSVLAGKLETIEGQICYLFFKTWF
jgi:hypothetical protein